MNAEPLSSETLSSQEVALRVRPYVTSRHVGDIALRIDDSRIHLRNGYWNIPIRPSRWPNPLFPYYEALAEIEDEVQKQEGLKVTLASGEPLTEDQ
jgi:hypothetical protein